MKDPKADIEITVSDALQGIIGFYIPTYVLGEEGMKNGENIYLPICKGTKEVPEELRNTGVFTESLIQVCILYLQDVNKGDLQNINTTEAIQYLKASLGSLDERRKKRETDGTLYTQKR